VTAPPDLPLFYSCFRHLAARPNPDLRRACAAQLLPLMRAPLPGVTHAYFLDTWLDMASDHDEAVRAQIVGSMGQIVALMAPTEAGKLLRRPLVAALGDEAPAVRAAALGVLAGVMGGLAGMEEPHREALGGELHAVLLRVQVRPGGAVALGLAGGGVAAGLGA